IPSEVVVGVLAPTVRTLLVATAFALRYAVRAAAAPTPTTAPTLGPAGPVPVGRRFFGLATAAVALVVWAYSLAMVTPGVERDDMYTGELHIWVQEQRQAAILLAALALLVAMAGRGPVVPSVVLVIAVLGTADSLLDRADAA